METQSFFISGMTCAGCVEKITGALKENKNIQTVSLDLVSGSLKLESERPVSVSELNRQLQPLKKYTVSNKMTPEKQAAAKEVSTVPWYQTYYPLLLVFVMSMGIPFSVLGLSGAGYARWMPLAMGTSLVVISFFKFLDLKKFSEGFSTYDPIAQKVPGYGWLYPFLELAAGIMFLSGIWIQVASAVAAVILSVTSIGVLSALRQKRTIQCACLGTVFNLPLTKVTIVENAVMITMAVSMLFYR